MTRDEDFTSMFCWFGLAFVFCFAALPLLFVLFPYIGPFGMLASFAAAFGCIFRGMFVGWQKIIGK